MQQCCGVSSGHVYVGHIERPEWTSVSSTGTLNPGHREWLSTFADHDGEVAAPPRAFLDPAALARSFSAFWGRVTREPFPG